MEGCHRDGNPFNNALDNLRWDTPASNAADRNLHGTQVRGDRLSYSKLSESEVLEINSMLLLGVKNVEIAKKFGVRHSTISAIKKGDNWAWLTGR